MAHEGQTLPDQLLGSFQFTFEKDKVTFKGIDGAGKPVVEVNAYTIDPTASPKKITVIDSKSKKPGLGIYEVTKDELRICIRDDKSSKGYPSAFASPPNSETDLIVLTRKK